MAILPETIECGKWAHEQGQSGTPGLRGTALTLGLNRDETFDLT